jgi:putative N6-adenine-specific DNA methylase
LRATLAAAVLLRAGYTGRKILCDPMCGSGTFAIEGALIAKKIPPGWHREFAFQQWPAFRAGRWRHIRRTAAPPEIAWPQPAIYASDQQAAVVRPLQQALSAQGLDDIVRVAQSDFENIKGRALSPIGGIVVLNPPYGRRLGSRKSAAETYARIGRHLKSVFKGWKAAVLAPNRRLADLLELQARHYVMRHGGQTVHLLIGKIPP